MVGKSCFGVGTALIYSLAAHSEIPIGERHPIVKSIRQPRGKYPVDKD